MERLLYRSTRGAEKDISASVAIVQGLAKDGGLYVPQYIPSLGLDLSSLMTMTYQEIACHVLGLFLPDFTKEEIAYCVENAYDESFDTQEIAPLVEKDGHYYLELFHGATIAFKDMALSILPYLMTTAAKKLGIKNEIVILTATSGDTGKAALAGFSDVEGTRIVVFYPKDGVSKVQERQMITSEGKNTRVIGIEGNFDDAQSGVKAIFQDKAFNEAIQKDGYQLSSANSINIGRLIPQVVYYVYAYRQLMDRNAIKPGDPMNVIVPTGNFGNILAAYYAKQMGIPMDKLVCASNENKVLYDFFQTGAYDRRRDFVLTMSPSMDILISSNLERLIFAIADENPGTVKEMMDQLSHKGIYSITPKMKDKLQEFYAAFASEEDTLHAIKAEYDKTGYIIDPHTAVAKAAYDAYMSETQSALPSVIVSTASPYKFTQSTMMAIDKAYKGVDDFKLIDALYEQSGVPIPEAVNGLEHKTIYHDIQCKKESMADEVKKFLI